MTDSPFFVNDWGQGLNNWLLRGELISEEESYSYGLAFLQNIYQKQKENNKGYLMFVDKEVRKCKSKSIVSKF